MAAYKAIGVRQFVGKMVLDLTRRLADFESHVMAQQKADPERSHVRSKRQWMIEYAMWCAKHRED